MSAAPLSVAELDANAGTAREMALAPPRTLINSRRFIRFIVGSLLGCYGLRETGCEGFSRLKKPLYLRRRKNEVPTFKKLLRFQNFFECWRLKFTSS